MSQKSILPFWSVITKHTNKKNLKTTEEVVKAKLLESIKEKNE